MRGLATLTSGLDQLLAEAGERHGDRLVLLCSFQKEESLLVDSISRVAPDTRVAMIDTGVLFPETLATWRAFEERYGVVLDVVDASGPWTGPEYCCGAAKVAALEHALDGAEAWVTGIRRDQSPTRANAREIERDTKRGIVKYNPLARWTDKDVWRAIKENELPYNPLHDQGYDSIGCAPCTIPGAGRDGRWAGTSKLECGLHVV